MDLKQSKTIIDELEELVYHMKLKRSNIIFKDIYKRGWNDSLFAAIELMNIRIESLKEKTGVKK